MANLSSYLKKQYAAQNEQALAELRGAYNKNVQAIDEKAAEIPAQYEAAKSEAAVQTAIAKKNFNEQAAATGLNSGTSGQAELARSNAYMSALSNLNRGEADAQQALERDRLNLQTDYENAIAAQNAANEAALQGALYQEMLRQATSSGGGKKPVVDDWTWLNEGVTFSSTPMESRTKSGLRWQLQDLATNKGGQATLEKLKAYAPYMTADEYKALYNDIVSWFEG